MIPGILGLISAIPSIAHIFTGIHQQNLANQLAAQYPRPTMTTPEALTKAGDIYGNNATMNMFPGQQWAADQQGANTANLARALSQSSQNPAARLAGISSLQTGSNNALGELGAEAGNFKMGNVDRYAQYLGQQLAPQQRANWDYNFNQPYQKAAAAASAETGASMQNKNEGLNGLTSVAMNLLTPNSKTGKYFWESNDSGKKYDNSMLNLGGKWGSGSAGGDFSTASFANMG